MKTVFVLTSTFPRWKNDTTPSFVFELSKQLGKQYKIIVLAPHALNSAKIEKIGNITVYRFRYFIPEKYQRLAYGAGLLPNIKKNLLAKIQLPFFIISQIKSADDIIKREHIDLIHAHWMVPQGWVGKLLKKKYEKYGIPLIVTVHGSDLFPLKNQFFKYIQRSVINNADIVTVNSSIAKKEILYRFPEIKEIKSKLKIIPMGIDTKRFKPKEVEEKMRDRFKEYKNNRVILFVGRLNEQKGVEYLIKAMPKVVSDIKNSRLLIIGEGHHRKKLEYMVKDLGLNDFVEFLAPKNHKELPHYYNLSEVLVLPSITTKIGTESFGLVLLEAMASSTCVIGSSSGGIKNIIKDGINGLIFKEKNHEELAGKIIEILNNPKLRERLRKNGLKYARKNYDWTVISKKFLDVYARLLKI